jgi:hypothetical protein
LVDCEVTGSHTGSVSKPKFALKTLWQHVLLPTQLDKLVAVGGACEGAMVVFQEDNAGPHTEGDYRAWMLTEFDSRGWIVALQAPQGTIMCHAFAHVCSRSDVSLL